MIKDFRLSGQKTNHRVGDFRAGLPREDKISNFLLIQKHNTNVRNTKISLSITGIGRVSKIFNGIKTEILCSGTRKVIVKTFNDGTSQVMEEN